MKHNIVKTTLIWIVLCLAPIGCLAEELDYCVQGKAERVYELKFGEKVGCRTCTLKIEIAEKKDNRKDDKEAETLFDVDFSYTDFTLPSEDGAGQEDPWSEFRKIQEVQFNFRATIDKYGIIVSSDLGEKTKAFESMNASNKRFAKVVIKPMIVCTWLCAFPRLGPVESGELRGYKVRGWGNLKMPSLERDLSFVTERVIRCNAVFTGGIARQCMLWSDVTEVASSREYGANNEVTETTKFKLHYDFSKKAITSGVFRLIINSIEDEEENETFFQAEMK